jgi:hypothetical protein
MFDASPAGPAIGDLPGGLTSAEDAHQHQGHEHDQEGDEEESLHGSASGLNGIAPHVAGRATSPDLNLSRATARRQGTRGPGPDGQPPPPPHVTGVWVLANHPRMFSTLAIQWLGLRRIPWGSPGTRTSTASTPSNLSAW